MTNTIDRTLTDALHAKTPLFRPLLMEGVRVTSGIVHFGRTTMVVQTDVTNRDGALVSRTLQTQVARIAV